MIKLEVEELIARHKSVMSEQGTQISQLEKLADSLDQKMAEKDELNALIKTMKESKSSEGL